MDSHERIHDSTDAMIERAKSAALGKHDGHPSHVDEAGEAVGGIGGTFVGAAIGAAGGPIGMIIGGMAGAIGGWWSGRAVTEAVSKVSHTDDDFYREFYETSPHKLADRSYDDVRPAYQLGHIASHNPAYANSTWNDVQSDLRRGWTTEHARTYGEWDAASNFVRDGFTRGREQQRTKDTKDTSTPDSAFSDS